VTFIELDLQPTRAVTVLLLYFPGTGVPVQMAGKRTVYNNRPIMLMPVTETEPASQKSENYCPESESG
jgi:hypothetical protein